MGNYRWIKGTHARTRANVHTHTHTHTHTVLLCGSSEDRQHGELQVDQRDLAHQGGQRGQPQRSSHLCIPSLNLPAADSCGKGDEIFLCILIKTDLICMMHN